MACQFGAKFFPDKVQGYREARRVLSPDRRFMFNVWDRIENNEIADAVTTGLRSVFSDDPPQFLPRTPYGYHNPGVIRQHLAEGGFSAAPDIATVTARSRAESAQVAAIAFCQGTPLRTEIETFLNDLG